MLVSSGHGTDSQLQSPDPKANPKIGSADELGAQSISADRKTLSVIKTERDGARVSFSFNATQPLP